MSWWEVYKNKGRNHFSGVLTVAGYELLKYEGWEQDWNVLGYEDWQNKALGSYFSCVCEDERFGKYSDGATRIVHGTGKTQKEAVKRLKTTIVFSVSFWEWRDKNPLGTAAQYHESDEYKNLCNENNL